MVRATIAIIFVTGLVSIKYKCDDLGYLITLQNQVLFSSLADADCGSTKTVNFTPSSSAPTLFRIDNPKVRSKTSSPLLRVVGLNDY